MRKVLIVGEKKDNIIREIVKKIENCNDLEMEKILITSVDDDVQSTTKQDIIVISEPVGAKEFKHNRHMSCHILLTPGNERTDLIDTDCVVSYGMSGRNTITLSSIGESECVLSLQRELVTVAGRILERQELPVSCLIGLSKEELMAVFGTLLLLEIQIL